MSYYKLNGYETPKGVNARGAVQKLQTFINTKTGANLKADGIWGPKTQAAYDGLVHYIGSPGGGASNAKHPQGGYLNSGAAGYTAYAGPGVRKSAAAPRSALEYLYSTGWKPPAQRQARTMKLKAYVSSLRGMRGLKHTQEMYAHIPEPGQKLSDWGDYVIAGYENRMHEGANSREKVARAQRELGVRPDGVWGKRTQKAYEDYLGQIDRRIALLTGAYKDLMGITQAVPEKKAKKRSAMQAQVELPAIVSKSRSPRPDSGGVRKQSGAQAGKEGAWRWAGTQTGSSANQGALYAQEKEPARRTATAAQYSPAMPYGYGVKQGGGRALARPAAQPAVAGAQRAANAQQAGFAGAQRTPSAQQTATGGATQARTTGNYTPPAAYDSVAKIAHLQKQLGVTVSGRWDARTENAYRLRQQDLTESVRTTQGNHPPPAAYRSAAQIAYLQKQLDVQVDGIWDGETQAAYEKKLLDEQGRTQATTGAGGDNAAKPGRLRTWLGAVNESYAHGGLDDMTITIQDPHAPGGQDEIPFLGASEELRLEKLLDDHDLLGGLNEGRSHEEVYWANFSPGMMGSTAIPGQAGLMGLEYYAPFEAAKQAYYNNEGGQYTIAQSLAMGQIAQNSAAQKRQQQDAEWERVNDAEIARGNAGAEAPKWPKNDSQIKHIFRNKEGHLPDAPKSRSLVESIVNSDNYLGTDARGTQWYAQIQPDGRQVWARSYNGTIINAGLNETPKPFDIQTGLNKNPLR